MKIAITGIFAFFMLLFGSKLLSASMKHPLHFSLTNIEYNQQTKCVAISAKFFVKDLSDAFLKTQGKMLDVISGKPEEVDLVIQEFFCKNFSVYINDTKIKNSNFEFKARKINEDCIWIYVDLKKIKSVKKIVVNNSFFCNLFQDQTNLMIIDINNSQQSFNLSCEHNMAIATF